jgi:hypothetical protein
VAGNTKSVLINEIGRQQIMIGVVVEFQKIGLKDRRESERLRISNFSFNNSLRSAPLNVPSK